MNPPILSSWRTLAPAWMEAAAGDAMAIAQVQVASWRIAYRGLMSDEVLNPTNIESSAQHWKHCIEETPLRFWVAIVDDLLVGYCSLDPDGDEDTAEDVGDIPSCYVLPCHWR